MCPSHGALDCEVIDTGTCHNTDFIMIVATVITGFSSKGNVILIKNDIHALETGI